MERRRASEGRLLVEPVKIVCRAVEVVGVLKVMMPPLLHVIIMSGRVGLRRFLTLSMRRVVKLLVLRRTGVNCQRDRDENSSSPDDFQTLSDDGDPGKSSAEAACWTRATNPPQIVGRYVRDASVPQNDSLVRSCARPKPTPKGGLERKREAVASEFHHTVGGHQRGHSWLEGGQVTFTKNVLAMRAISASSALFCPLKVSRL